MSSVITTYSNNTESRAKAINQFCAFTMLFASPYIFILYQFEHPFSVFVMAVLILLFYSCILLNKTHRTEIAKIVLIFTTNFSVLYFDILLGFNSGIHLYLFTAPLIVYLLFDYKEKRKVLISLSSYLLNFIFIFIVYKFNLIKEIETDPNAISYLYAINLSFSLILSFILIVYFAFINSSYNTLLIDINSNLEAKKTELESEIEEKNKTQNDLLKTLKEKDILMAEVHHRVKNNLAFISGLLQLQNFYIKDEKAASVIQESYYRIKSISILHEKFYESNNLEKIDIQSYINELLIFLKLSFSHEKKEIIFHPHIDHISLNLAQSMPFSLLLNELITNSFKHAFKDSTDGNIYISLTKANHGFEFIYKDDGVGFDLSLVTKDKSLGLNLINTFTQELKGTLQFNSEKNKGMCFTSTLDFD